MKKGEGEVKRSQLVRSEVKIGNKALKTRGQTHVRQGGVSPTDEIRNMKMTGMRWNAPLWKYFKTGIFYAPLRKR